MIRWEALNGTNLIKVGKRRNGRTHWVLALNVLVVMTEGDAKLVAKVAPGLKFVRKGRK